MKVFDNNRINNILNDKMINNKIEEFDLNNNIELECKILTLRDKLNESVNEGRDYDYIYKLSLELDSLIEQYYKESVIK